MLRIEAPVGVGNGVYAQQTVFHSLLPEPGRVGIQQVAINNNVGRV